MYPGIDPTWLAVNRKYCVLGEEYQRLARQFTDLCDEFDRRLKALFDALKMAEEKVLIQQTLLPERTRLGGEHDSS